LGQRDQELAQARSQIGFLESELAAARKQVADLEGSLQQSRADVAERERRLAEQRGRIEELERENAGFQDQVLRAFSKIRNDAQLAEKARKALAIAAALLEEQMRAAGDGSQSDRAPDEERA